MIPDFKTYINESIWSDIQKRSAGDTVRKEDDVNNLDIEEFFAYLTEHYKPISKKITEEIGGRPSIIDPNIIEIFIPIESIDNRIKTLVIEIDKRDNNILIASARSLFDKYTNLERMLSNNYTLHTIKLNSRIYIKPKEKPTYQICLDIIDIFLAVVDNPILVKIS